MRRFKRRMARASPDDLAPRCPPLVLPDLADYPADLAAKVAKVRGLLEEHLPRGCDGTPLLDVVPSPQPVHYRHRVSFSLRHHSDGSVGLTIFDPQREEWIEVEEYPIVSRRINRLMRDLRVALAQSPRAREEAFAVDFVSNTGGGALACLKYHRRLDQRSDGELAHQLTAQLGATVVLRARRQRLVGANRRGFLVQNSQVGARCFPQHFLESCFFQASPQVNRAMQRWVERQTLPEALPPQRDLLELFCGNGNFTLPAAGNFRRVLATELDKRTVAAAKACARQASVSNIRFKRLKAEDVDLAGGVNRATDGPDGFNFSTLLVDPPRQGLDENSLTIASSFERVLYISCNPQALANNLQQLPEHQVAAACLFDQFPWTDHAEVGVRLERRCRLSQGP